MSLSEQLTTARAYGKIAKGVFTASPGDVIEGLRSAAMAKYLKERFATDAMIQRAFAKTQPAQYTQPNVVTRPVAGALKAAPIFTPPPADASGPIRGRAPYVSPETRAVRLGLLLPEARPPLLTAPPMDTSGPIRPPESQ